MRRLAIYIVDNNIIFRETLSKIFAETEDCEVIDTSTSGKIALDRIRRAHPDYVILDTELKDVTAEDFTRQALQETPRPNIILSGTANASSADNALFALQAGALDFVQKPDNILAKDAVDILRRRFLHKIRALSIRRYSKLALQLSAKKNATDEYLVAHGTEKTDQAGVEVLKLKGASGRYKILVIGVSTGGPEALSAILPQLPPNFPLPVVIVLHMPENFTTRMADLLNKKSQNPVKEAAEGDVLQPGHIYLARGGKHLFVEHKGGQDTLHLNTDPPENECRPAVDVLFRSVAPIFGRQALVVILTGMGEDGTKGMKLLKEHGAKTLVQDEETSVVWGMPGSAVKAGCVDHILPLKRIPGAIVEMLRDT